MLYLAFLQSPDLVELRQHAGRGIPARADRRILREVEQHRLQHVALVVQRHAADEVGGVLAVGEPASGFIARTTRRQHVHGRPADAPVHEGIGVDRDEEIGLVGACTPDAVAELHEIIAGTRQHGFHAGLRVYLVGELLRDRECDILLARAGLADRARIFTAMARIDRDDEVALALAARHFDRHGRLRLRGRRCEAVAEVDHEPVAVRLVRRRKEGLGLDFLADVEHNAQPRAAALAKPHGFYDTGPVGCPEGPGIRVDALEVDDHPLGIRQGEDGVAGGCGKVEHDARGVGARPDANVLERGGCRRRKAGGEQQQNQAHPP
jgi:hypothetical protein